MDVPTKPFESTSPTQPEPRSRRCSAPRGEARTSRPSFSRQVHARGHVGPTATIRDVRGRAAAGERVEGIHGVGPDLLGHVVAQLLLHGPGVDAGCGLSDGSPVLEQDLSHFARCKAGIPAIDPISDGVRRSLAHQVRTPGPVARKAPEPLDRPGPP